MTIIRWQNRPTLSNMMNNLFERDLLTGFDRNCGCVPATNILEKSDRYEIQLAVPGMKKEDFQMEADNNVLTITYERKTEESSNDDEQFLRKEYDLEGFTRSFTLPKHVNIDQIGARYDYGMLYISVPRTDPKKDKLTRKIEIA